jgi:hypothetical protein
MIRMSQKQRAGTLTDDDRREWNAYARQRQLSPAIEGPRVFTRQHPGDAQDLIVEVKAGAENHSRLRCSANDGPRKKLTQNPLPVRFAHAPSEMPAAGRALPWHRCRLHADVPASYAGKPFADAYHKSGPPVIPGIVQCALYDLGGEGVRLS